MAFGCGQCLACRINRRRVWTHRIMLEQTQHSESSFVTLTYNDENYPLDHSVSPRTLQLFLKRLRKKWPHPLRYFAVGEYGEQTFRPHYHAALFGYATCAESATRYNRHGEVACCNQCRILHNAWGLGLIHSTTLCTESAAYTAGYVTKKLTNPDNPKLEGRLPEFARMSLKPGLGYDAMHQLAHVLMTHGLDEKLDDVPTQLQHGLKKWPLGRYLRKKLRTMIGKDEKTPQKVLDKMVAQMLPMRQAAFDASQPFAQEVLKNSLGKRIQIDALEKRKRKKSL
jgi:hypothetical protein